MRMFYHRRVLSAAVIAASLGLAIAAPWSRVRAADTAGQPGVSPELSQAIDLLSGSADVKAADEAVAKLQTAMADQARKVIAAQKLLLQVQEGLAQQLTALTGIKDAEGEARVAGLLEFNSAIYTWASSASALDSQQREAVLDWGLKSENLPLIAKVYGHDTDAKTDAIHQIAKQDPSPATDYMLQVLLNDKDREISLLTLDALFDRKPSAALIDPLCDRAFGYILNQNRISRPQQQHIITVHGRQMSFYDNPNQVNYNSQDSDIIADLLVQYHDPKIGDKLNSMLSDFADSITNVNDGRVYQVISSNYTGSSAFAKLIEAYKPKSAVALCVKVLQSQSNNTQDQNINFNGIQGMYHMSTRVDAMALLATGTGQDPNDYGLVKLQNYNNRWMIQGNASDENDSIKKAHDWLDKHGKDYGIDTAGTFPPNPAPGNPGIQPGGRRGGFGGPITPVPAPVGGLP